jgi:hypothetical protein
MEVSEKEKYLQQISTIKSLMESNTKFLSLSGLSGVWAGSVALVGCALTALYMHDNFFLTNTWSVIVAENNNPLYANSNAITLFLFACIILFFAVAGGFVFTYFKVQQLGETLWNSVSKKMLFELFSILSVGGIFCIIQLMQHQFLYLISTTLLFYGLALFHISKYTVRDIQYLSFLLILLGLLNTIFHNHGVLFWCIGFGLLHIFYGTAMYFKYDRIKD